jgi:hypothetical protein
MIVFMGAFFTLFVSALILEAMQLSRARKAWDKARVLGIEFSGEFPHLSMKRGNVSFASRTESGAKGARIYIQEYLASGFRLKTPSNEAFRLALQHAGDLGLQFDWSGDCLAATCHGVPMPGAVLDRLDALAALVKASGASAPR